MSIEIVLDSNLDTILKFIDMGFVSHINAGEHFDDLLEEARDKDLVDSSSSGWFSIIGVTVYSSEPENGSALTLSI